MPQKEKNKQALNNNEVWHFEYRQNCYMGYIAEDELKI